ncbi:MAG: bifunctional folylpolyglutamate synthase/dihydrofolate synthase [Dehalococcoidales bacterium]|nr:bifunctional folylpolyglutamate synthase/dihydrofolate synthase [Dehalococcoidales bacterium]
MDYKEALDYVYGYTNYEAVPRPHAGSNYDLRRLFETLERLDNPHLKARSLHISGTNGKGSTAAMLASILVEAGYITGLYTSPHLVTTRERFSVNRSMISEGELAALVTRLKPEIETTNREARYGRLTVFEILTLLAFMYFTEKRCQFQVMEVGMGGRYDATNVIQPEVCLLTSISFDHTAVLGNTLTQIASEKCGIIKPGCTVISHPQEQEAAAVISRTCLDLGVTLIQVGSDVRGKRLGFDIDSKGIVDRNGIDYHQEVEIEGRLDSYRVSIPLLGQYQIDNAAAALAAVEVLIERGCRISKENILRGLAVTGFPGRLQIVSRHPLIVLDGGHNPGAARNLKKAISEYFKPAGSVLVFGISSDKDIAGVVAELAPVFQTVIVTRANSPRSARLEHIASEFAACGRETRICENVREAVSLAESMVGERDLICITGSLYVVGEAIASIRRYNPDSL